MFSTIRTYYQNQPVRLMEIRHEDSSGRDQSLSFKLAPAIVSKKALDQVDGILKLNNDYWADLPKERQDEIFRVYHAFQNERDDSHHPTAIEQTVTRAVHRLIELHPVDHVYRWLKSNSGYYVPPPPSVALSYVPNDPNSRSVETTRDQTYIRDDYIHLIALTLVLKTLLPIWGELLLSSGSVIGAKFKENETFRTLVGTPLYTSIPMEKLFTYIKMMSRKDADNDRNRLDGTSPEDYAHYLCCRICVRKLCSFDLVAEDNLVGAIFSHIRQGGQSTPMDGRQVEIKDSDGPGGDDSTSMTPLETYRPKTTLTPGDLAEIDATPLKWRQLVAIVDITVPEDLLNHCIETAKVLENYQFHRCQITLMKWVFSAAVPPDTFDLIKDNSQKHLAIMAGCAEAILRHRGHHWLALMVSARNNLQGSSALTITSTDANMQIPAELKYRLEAAFPLSRNARSNGRRSTVSTTCTAEIDINELNRLIRDNAWIATADMAFITSVTNEEQRRIRSRSDIKMLLAELFIQIGTRQWQC